MKKLLSLILLALFFSNTAFSEDVIFEYNEKLSNTELSTNEIIEICNEYESKNIDIGQYDQATFHINISSFSLKCFIESLLCNSVKFGT
jgi:uncharacterized GH25 family protein